MYTLNVPRRVKYMCDSNLFQKQSLWYFWACVYILEMSIR